MNSLIELILARLPGLESRLRSQDIRCVAVGACAVWGAVIILILLVIVIAALAQTAVIVVVAMERHQVILIQRVDLLVGANLALSWVLGPWFFR